MSGTQTIPAGATSSVEARLRISHGLDSSFQPLFTALLVTAPSRATSTAMRIPSLDELRGPIHVDVQLSLWTSAALALAQEHAARLGGRAEGLFVTQPDGRQLYRITVFVPAVAVSVDSALDSEDALRDAIYALVDEPLSVRVVRRRTE